MPLVRSVVLVILFAALSGALNCNRAESHDLPAIVKHAIRFRGSEYEYYLSVPASPGPAKPLPLLFLVHGAGGNGHDFLQLWQDFAQQNEIILLAPTLQSGAELEKQVPELFPALVEDAKEHCKIDTHRLYLFGYSAGGYSTFDAATLDSTYFTAATVLAGVVTADYDWIIERAQRKTPIAMYIGDRDEWFSLSQAQRTREVLLAHGFPVHYVEIPQQRHNYGATFAWVKQDSWNFMSKYTMP